MKTNSVLGIIKILAERLLSILLYVVTLSWLREIIQLIIANREVKEREEYLRNVRKGRRVKCSPRCAIIRPEVYKRADPLIYSQKYLREQGLAVTWNNPDIQLYKEGVPVSSSQLEVDTEYEIVATIYNNSTEAPAVGLPVEFSFLGFGIGTVSNAIGTTIVNLPVKGAPGHPAQAKTIWRTPNQEGHYCLQVNLRWADDANPKNNFGQENTNVGHFSSPAFFEFPVHNNDTIQKFIHLIADSYKIPQKMDCKELPKKKHSDKKFQKHKRLDVFVPPLEEEADWTFARVRHGADVFPMPQDWQVAIEPEEMLLEPDQQQIVKVTITPPEGFKGEKIFNINAMHGNALIGGVTLTATSQVT